MADAVEALAPYVDEVFADDEALDAAADLGIIPSPKNLRAEWDARIDAIFAEAQLERAQTVSISGGRQGRHGEQMGFLLADLQYVQRTYPGLTW
jgi:ring-1,2-phenylacetyl-CoA epoxidase subunit PaaC